MNFLQIQDEIKRGATRDQGGSTFNSAVKAVINRAIKHLSNESYWRPLRRSTFITTSTQYTVGNGGASISVGSDSLTVTGASFLSDFTKGARDNQNQMNTVIGRQLTLEGSTTKFTIRTVFSEAILSLDKVYDGTSALSSGDYSMLPQEEYLLPIQASHRMFLWHEGFGTPYLMNFITDQDFYDSGTDRTTESTPTHYHMWDANTIRQPLNKDSKILLGSSSSSDTNINITIMGHQRDSKTNALIPVTETVATDSSNGITGVSSTTTFSSIDRITKGASTVGYINIADASNSTVLAVIPSGDVTRSIQYKKIRLYPLPNTDLDINIFYYKDPYDLVADTDIHDLGDQFDQAIIFYSTALLKYEDNMDEGDKFLQLYKDEIKLLRRTNVDKIDWIPKLRRPYESRGRGDSLGGIQKFLGFRNVGSNFGPSGRI